ncbi:hypothetical protein BD410DRAFT_330482 [Rickenella mellea]|uniref:Carbohydrate kinase PfkB domain-containing protein n=1 Tax=Rickenella mellea TaxID=50990 RepID=A0A4Y7QKA9_9AGAM|nr:hypothetical protein BD410DRAFT_330482 [Rickenella mellea]
MRSEPLPVAAGHEFAPMIWVLQSNYVRCSGKASDFRVPIDPLRSPMFINIYSAGLFAPVSSIVRPGETISSERYERRAGGKGANQASAVAKAGGSVVLKLLAAPSYKYHWKEKTQLSF